MPLAGLIFGRTLVVEPLSFQLALLTATASIVVVAAIVVAAVVVAVGRSLGALLLVLLGSP
jgi:hypothetical protein